MEQITDSNQVYFHPSSTWLRTSTNNWELFSDTESKFKRKEKQEPTDKVTQQTIASKNEELVLGTLVMTPNLIGRLINIEESLATIKFNQGSDLTFDLDQVTNDFNILIRFIGTDSKQWIKMSLPSNGSVNLIKSMIDCAISDQDDKSYSLIYNGVELIEDKFFDQINIQRDSKLLVYSLKTKPYKICRYGVSYTYWYTYACDGITFTVNKKVRLYGMGMYGSHEGKTQSATLKITEGILNSGNVLYEEPIEVPPAPDQNNAIVFHQLKRPVTIKAETDYIIQLISTQYCYLYYGGQGKARIEGEKGIVFTFKFTQGASHGSSIEYGNFPEFHYYS